MSSSLRLGWQGMLTCASNSEAEAGIDDNIFSFVNLGAFILRSTGAMVPVAVCRCVSLLSCHNTYFDIFS